MWKFRWCPNTFSFCGKCSYLVNLIAWRGNVKKEPFIEGALRNKTEDKFCNQELQYLWHFVLLSENNLTYCIYYKLVAIFEEKSGGVEHWIFISNRGGWPCNRKNKIKQVMGMKTKIKRRWCLELWEFWNVFQKWKRKEVLQNRRQDSQFLTFCDIHWGGRQEGSEWWKKLHCTPSLSYMHCNVTQMYKRAGLCITICNTDCTLTKSAGSCRCSVKIWKTRNIQEVERRIDF